MTETLRRQSTTVLWNVPVLLVVLISQGWSEVYLDEFTPVLNCSEVIQNCFPCQAGQYANNTVTCCGCCNRQPGFCCEASCCSKCEPGYYQNTTEASSCTPCEEGTYSENAGETTCYDCSPGWFSNQTGASSCEKCDAGTHARKPAP
ncbi:signal peptide, CUB and EGF-like domain-containing protein 1 [Liolophura sinensis]|uniref:signal peptide, CUB and EGF-like domain-containing protein 1 n=1 Tax=Liolophura sinensis TaxID=3198878 RepID=UPI0031584F56